MATALTSSERPSRRDRSFTLSGMGKRSSAALIGVAVVCGLPGVCQAAPWRNVDVPTGAFAVSLPQRWIAITASSSAVMLKAFAKSPGLQAIAKQAEAGGALKLFATDTGQGNGASLDV